MEDNYFIVDIETAPLDPISYEKLDEESKLKLLNPIDSKIIAIGIRHDNKNLIFMGEEKSILENFWKAWYEIRTDNPLTKVIGFNITDFDMPFITARSFINNVKIIPFTLKYILDLRDKISAYKSGKVRGKLKEFAALMNLEIKEVDGKDMARLYSEKKYETIKDYLINDLIITERIYERAKETNIIKIERW
jgi:uncharacterized protein YprB with RNaseH-like and TPR domain